MEQENTKHFAIFKQVFLRNDVNQLLLRDNYSYYLIKESTDTGGLDSIHYEEELYLKMRIARKVSLLFLI